MTAAKRKTFLIMAVGLLLGLWGFQPPIASAQNLKDEAPAFTSVADAARAQQAAVDAANSPSPEAVAAMTAEEKAGKALGAAIKSGNADAIAAAREDHQAAEIAARAAMAQMCGVTPDTIASMRGMQMAWGQIAQEFGINHNTMGLGAKNGSQHGRSQMTPATGRNVKTGGSMMSGFHAGRPSDSHGMGLSRGTQNHGWGSSSGWGHMGNSMGDTHSGGYNAGHNNGMGSGTGGHGGNDSGGSGGGGGGHGGNDSGGSGGGGGGHGGNDSGGSGGGGGGGGHR